MILMIDNYDSFTYNLVQYLGELGEKLIVHRNDKITLRDVERLKPKSIVISPGPGRPEDAGISKQVIERFGERVPILGVCLGHQCIGEVYGGKIVSAKRLMHGKTSLIHYTPSPLFQGLPNPFDATRYHSLVIQPESLPDCLNKTAWTDDGEIMAVQHRSLPLMGVQFHPESILTSVGKQLLQNFLKFAQQYRKKKV